jgi:sugar phosphate isomerase/epimerase
MTGKKIPIGLQLYSVRQACEKDLPAVLQAVAQMSYQGVEFAGYYGRKADQLRKLLDDNGLLCCGTHTGWNTVNGDALKGTVEFNKTIGNKYLIVPGLPGDREKSAEACKETGRIFSDIAAKVKDEGMRVGYHAHGGDFKKFDGETAWDLIFSNSSPDVVMQMDIGNCIGGGGDPYATLKKFPGRSLTIHFKPHGNGNAVIGEDEVRWNDVFEICQTTGGTEWYIVEYEEDPAKVDSVRKCIENLRKMGK